MAKKEPKQTLKEGWWKEGQDKTDMLQLWQDGPFCS